MKIKLIILKVIEFYKRKMGRPIVDYKRGCGYYLPTGLFGVDPLKSVKELKMESGKIMNVKLLDYQCYNDPRDMVEWAKYQYLGYKGEKQLADYSLIEYLKKYQLI